jgi:hypothetical protein
LTQNDWRYLAGLFDGEGCVTICVATRKTATSSCQAGTRALNTSLRIANNDPRVLLWLEKNFGGKVRQHSAKRLSWVWIVQGDKSVEAASQLLKYSRMKKDQLEAFIALQALRVRSGMRVSERDWRQREKLVNVIRMSEYRRKAS